MNIHILIFNGPYNRRSKSLTRRGSSGAETKRFGKFKKCTFTAVKLAQPETLAQILQEFQGIARIYVILRELVQVDYFFWLLELGYGRFSSLTKLALFSLHQEL